MQKLFGAVVSQITDMLHANIRSKVSKFLACSVLSMLHKDCGEVIPQNQLAFSEYLWLVINHRVVIGGISFHDLLEMLLFMRINQYTPFYCFCNVAVKDFFSLKIHITVGDNPR